LEPNVFPAQKHESGLTPSTADRSGRFAPSGIGPMAATFGDFLLFRTGDALRVPLSRSGVGVAAEARAQYAPMGTY
jgi:hypothetical protein